MYFVELDNKWCNNFIINILFNKRKRNFIDRHHNEIYRLKWIHNHEFKNCIDDRVWSFIKNFINSNITHEELVDNIKQNRLNCTLKDNIMKKYIGRWVSFKPIDENYVGIIKILRDASGCSVIIFNRVIKPNNNILEFKTLIDNTVIEFSINMVMGIGNFYMYSNTQIGVLRNQGSIELTEL